MKQYKLKPSIIKLKEGATAPEAVQILRVGKFSHALYGDFEITKETLRNLKENFDKNVRGIDLAIDYSHNNQDEAAGWFKDVVLKDDDSELWAVVDWTPAGKKSLESKEFRYLSADFAFDYESEETKEKFGPTLMGAGLTNRPFVKAMAPAVELKEQSGGKMELKELEQKIAKLTEVVEAIAKPKTVELSEVEKENAKLKEDLAKAEQDKKDLESKHAEEKQLAEKRDTFAALMKDGKVCKAQEKAYLEGNMEEFVKLAENISLTPAGAGKTPTEGDTKSAQDEIVALANKLVEEKKAKTLSEAQRIVIRENPELYKKAQAELE